MHGRAPQTKPAIKSACMHAVHEADVHRAWNQMRVHACMRTVPVCAYLDSRRGCKAARCCMHASSMHPVRMQAGKSSNTAACARHCLRLEVHPPARCRCMSPSRTGAPRRTASAAAGAAVGCRACMPGCLHSSPRAACCRRSSRQALHAAHMMAVRCRRPGTCNTHAWCMMASCCTHLPCRSRPARSRPSVFQPRLAGCRSAPGTAAHARAAAAARGARRGTAQRWRRGWQPCRTRPGRKTGASSMWDNQRLIHALGWQAV